MNCGSGITMFYKLECYVEIVTNDNNMLCNDNDKKVGVNKSNKLGTGYIV